MANNEKQLVQEQLAFINLQLREIKASIHSMHNESSSFLAGEHDISFLLQSFN